MKKKFFVRTLIISLSAMLIFGVASGFLISYSTEKMLKEDLVRISDILKAESVRESADYQNLVSFERTGKKAFRITFIDRTGNVFADSTGEIGANHLGRPEVESALEGKPIFVKRKSDTLNKRMMYYGVAFERFSDGETCVLRIAIETTSVTDTVWAAIPVLAIITVALVIALVITNQRYNSAFMFPLFELKNQLRTINSGDFKKIGVDKSNEELLPVINEINEIAENMNSLNKVRSEFFANASHELNTPLTYISGYAELMENGLLTGNAKIAECGAKIRQQTSRMSVLISDMLKLSKLENEPPETVMEEIDINKLIDSVLETLSLSAAEKNIKINVLCYEDIIVSNEKLLKDILTNLVQNAVKYNKEHGRIDISVRRNKKMLQISVQDTGIGIEREDLDRIFERFYRVDKARSRESGGTGLGLAIVKHSVLKLGGTVKVQSSRGTGAKFIVSLPQFSLESKNKTIDTAGENEI